MITLITFPRGWGDKSLSPFCTKAIYLLNAAGVTWDREDTLDPRKFPQGKLPAIRVDGQIIGDSENILAYLAGTGHDVDAHLGPEARAEAQAWKRLVEEHLYYHQVMDRWARPEMWSLMKQEYFGSLPFPVRHILPMLLRRKILSGLDFLGHTRQDPDMRMSRLSSDLAAIRTRLGDKPFFFGDRPCSLDASLGAVLKGMLAAPIDTPVRKRIAEDAILSDYADRVDAAMG